MYLVAKVNQFRYSRQSPALLSPARWSERNTTKLQITDKHFILSQTECGFFLKATFKVFNFFIQNDFRAKSCELCEVSVGVHSRVFLNPSPYKMRTVGGYSTSKRCIWF